MKKSYLKPETRMVVIKIESLLIGASSDEAKSGESGMSRGDNSDWDE